MAGKDAEAQSMWDQLYGEGGTYAQSGMDIEKMAGHREAAGARRTMGLTGAMAGGVGLGGAAMGAQAQAQIEGAQATMKARQDHAIRGMELQMTQLQNLMRQAEQAGDRVQAQILQDKINSTMLLMERIRAGENVPGPGEEGAGGGGILSDLPGLSEGGMQGVGVGTDIATTGGLRTGYDKFGEISGLW
jgi:hypothetical protein